jgi:hypothetical protein
MRTTLYILVEIRPDGTENEMYLGTQLKDGTRTTYTVNGDTAYRYQKFWQKEFPEFTYEMRMERV